MRILVTADAVGGVFPYALDLLRGLGELGAETHLAVLCGPLDESQRRAAAEVPGLTVYETTFRLEWMDDPGRDVERSGRWLQKLARQVRPEAVHLNQYAFGALSFGVPKLVVGHSCVTSWWEAVHGEQAPGRYDRYRALVAKGLQGAHMVVAPTRAYLEQLEQRYGPLGDARVVYNGVRSVPPGVDRQPVVIAAGRLWDEAKNLQALDRVARGLPWPVQVAGSAVHPDGRRFDASFATLLGSLPRETLLRRFQEAEILCHPAKYEPFGLVPLEAAAAGCALVLGDIPTLRELWDGAAIFVPPDQPDVIRAAIQALIDDPTRRRQLGYAARERSRRYPIAATVEAYRDVYRDLAAITVSTEAS